MKRKFIMLIAFVFLLLAPRSWAVTVIKAVGHGDCYVVISDGRVVVIDVGPGNAKGLVDFLASGHLHYDRIIITHVHSDHAGGLITAARYAEETGSAFTTDLLVSNHGEHDLDLIMRDEKIPDFLKAMHGKKTVAAITEEILNKMALDDPHMRVETIPLPHDVGESENRTGLIIKVTEIRDGESRATLFLGDIEAAQQQALFGHPEAPKVFENVRAVTMPHHGRKTTLFPDFFRKLKEVTSGEVVALHSDRAALDPEVRGWAREAGVKILSTAPTTKEATPHDVYVNLYDEPTYFVVKQPTTVRALALQRTALLPTVPKEVSTQELAETISNFNHRTMTEVLPAGNVLSLPTAKSIINYANSAKEQLFSDLQNQNSTTRDTAVASLSKMGGRLNSEQIERLVGMMRSDSNVVETKSWRGEHCTHYEEKTTKYYAGQVLENIQSPYVTEKIRRDARNAQTVAGGGIIERRNDDPGWT
jgi:beta-lactamase superfamily II metal-dependent hydrolase